MIRKGLTLAVTIRDIAREAGISKSAVAYALNNSDEVSAETRMRVQQIAKNLGWELNRAARSLSTARADAVALVITRPHRNLGGEAFHMDFISGVEQILEPRQLTLSFHLVESIDEELQIYRRSWAGRRIDGAILTDLRVNDARVSLMGSIGIPAICVAPRGDLKGIPTVETDEVGATELAVQHLLHQGHRRFARVTGPVHLAHVKVRDLTFARVLEESGIPPGVVVESDFTQQGGAEATARLLTLSERPTAIIYDNDVMAAAGLSTLATAGVRVPDDMAILAWDDSLLCRLTNPPLTAMSRDSSSLGAAAASLLVSTLTEEPHSQNWKDERTLVRRASTGAFPRS